MKILLSLLAAGVLLAQDRPPRFFREDWKEIPAATPITQEHVANSDLLLHVYGPGRAGVKKSHHDKPADDPYYVWSGTAAGTWVVTLQQRRHYADLTGKAKIRWRSYQAGFRHLRMVLKLADGTWLVSEAADGPTTDWRIREFNLSDVRWRWLDIDQVTEKKWAPAPDLRRVDEIGVTDLMPGGQSDACSRLDWIEVDGTPVPREKGWISRE